MDLIIDPDREIVSRYTRRCRFFTGLANDHCLAGVKYRVMLNGSCPSKGDPVPCIGRRSDQAVSLCSHRNMITVKEAKTMWKNHLAKSDRWKTILAQHTKRMENYSAASLRREIKNAVAEFGSDHRLMPVGASALITAAERLLDGVEMEACHAE